MPGTSVVMREARRSRRAGERCSTVTSITSTVLIARMMQGQSKERLPFLTPVDLKSGTTVKYCQTLPSRPAFANSSRRMASDSRTASRRSRVMAPGQRTPRPGPGNGWRSTIEAGRPSARPTSRTSSLKRILTGSTSSKREAMSSGRPPALWWALMPASLSRMSGQIVPCARNETPSSLRASSAKTSMNSSPMMWRFRSGSETPASLSRKRSTAST